jgi:hypothetical protein
MNMPYLRTTVIPAAAVAGFLLAAVGCQYQWGPVTHPQIRSLAVGTFANATRDSSATVILRGRIAEKISTEPGLSLAPIETADAIVEGRIVKVSQRQIARAELRQPPDRENDSDAYQTAIYRLDVTVQYLVRIPGYDRPFVERREVLGQADMGRWPDQQVYRANALALALADAATQIVASVTEAW